MVRIDTPQSAPNNAPSPQPGNISPITGFLGHDPTPPIGTFLRTKNTETVTHEDGDRERMLNVSLLKRHVAELHPMVSMELEANRRRKRQDASRGELQNFTEGDFVLVDREDFFAGEKLALRWRGPRRFIKALSDYVFRVEDLRNGSTEDVHGSRLKFHRYGLLNQEVILSHVLSSEMGMPVARMKRLVDTEDGLKVIVRWKGLPNSEDTEEPLERVFEDVPQMLLRLLRHKNTPAPLAEKARSPLSLRKRGM